MRLAYLASMAALVAIASPSVCCVDNGADAADAGSGGAADTAATDAAATAAPAPAAKAKKEPPGYVVWAMPGHATYAIGTMVKTTESHAESLRGAGHARLATDAEVAEHKKHGRPIHDFG